MYDQYQTKSEALAALLGRIVGSSVANVLAAVLFILFVFVIWGLPWERLIAKAGFHGRSYWVLLGMFFVPPLLGVVAAEHLGEYHDVSRWLGGTFAISTYLGLLTLAFCPWSVHRELRKLKEKPKELPKTKP